MLVFVRWRHAIVHNEIIAAGCWIRRQAVRMILQLIFDITDELLFILLR